MTVAMAKAPWTTTTGRGKCRSGGTVISLDGDELQLDAEVTVNRGDFGLTWNQMGMASMDNTLAIHAVFTRK